MKITRIILILLLLFAFFVTCAASCDPDPDPDGWQGNDGSPADGVYATETYGAEQWHAQLTALATGEP